MGLNTVQLTSGMLKGLYPESLVNSPSVKEDLGELSFLGKNARQICIIHQTKTASVISDKDLQFLTGVLMACNLTLEDVGIVNAIKKQTLQEIQNVLKPKVVLIFGVEAGSIGLPYLSAFTPTIIDNISFLATPAINEIAGDKSQKSSLWQCLKQIFNL